jgi:BirA family biotin operon repressor/biotin-[acetyl-CoA-carboxylase] ligase
MFESLLWLKETTSTQDFLKDKKLNPYTVVVADRQTKGRGRLGRSWHSQEGGLYLSFLLPRGLRDEKTLPLIVSYAVSELLKSLGFVPAIKWVNDVYLSGRKVCGVLVEGTKDRLVVGIGLNVNQEGFPQELKAISLRMVCGRVFDRVELLMLLLDFLKENLHRLKEEGFVVFKKDIEDRLLFKGQEVVLYTPEPVVGLLEGISADGSLLLMTSEGLKGFAVGDVSLRGVW